MDLHLHTNDSDGKYNVKKVIKKCEEKQLEVISIIDHDKVEDYKGLSSKIEVISGVEIKTEIIGVKVEVLAYGFNIEQAKQLEYINADKRDIEEETIELLKKRLLRSGYVIDKDINLGRHIYAQQAILDEIQKHEKNITKFNSIHNGYRLENINPAEFYRKICCNRETIFFVEGYENTEDIKNVVRDFKEIGAKLFLAHPFIYNRYEEVIKSVKDLVDGYECSHSDHSLEQTRELLEYCKQNNKLVSGGSDYYGTDDMIYRKLGEYNIKKEIKEKAKLWLEKI